MKLSLARFHPLSFERGLPASGLKEIVKENGHCPIIPSEMPK